MTNKFYPLTDNPAPCWALAYWQFEICQTTCQNYIAKLWVYDEFDDYLARWKLYESSPTFSSALAAKNYALNNWEHENPS